MSPAAPALRADSLPLSHRGSPQMFYFTTIKISKEEGYFMPLSCVYEALNPTGELLIVQ